MQEQAEIFIFYILHTEDSALLSALKASSWTNTRRLTWFNPHLSLLPVNIHQHRTEVPGPIRPRAEECGQPQHRQGLLLQYAQCGAQRQDVEEEEAAQRRMLSNCFLDNALIEMI